MDDFRVTHIVEFWDKFEMTFGQFEIIVTRILECLLGRFWYDFRMIKKNIEFWNEFEMTLG